MSALAYTLKFVALTMSAALACGAAVPACEMAECAAAPLDACSDFTPACDGAGGCDDTVLMKHTPDEATAAVFATSPAATPSAAAYAPALPHPLARAARLPQQTAAPPPPDALGVRLSI